MKEIICPNCGSHITVDESLYASIVNQVRNDEFNADVDRRVAELKAQVAAERKNTVLEAQNTIQKVEAAHAKEMAEKDQLISQLRASISQNKEKVALAVAEEKNRNLEAIQDKENTIIRLQEQMVANKEVASQKIALLNDEVGRLKEMKLRLSTKMIGESLEVHCSTVFNQMRASAFPLAYFEKDNDASAGSKGDFIFRDYDDEGHEIVSIMFEMKNEAGETATKHRNEDFFAKLDADRRQKRCEYAVLVSLLEPESELYNGGIVDVSYRYEKMYVIRPQFFLSFISLIDNAAKKTIDLQKQLIVARNQSVDVTNFESKLIAFRDGFNRNFQLASDKFAKAIAEIDNTIQHLQKVKDNLLSSGNQLRLANNKAEELSIKKLTYNNPTMKAKFDEARQLTDNNA